MRLKNSVVLMVLVSVMILIILGIIILNFSDKTKISEFKDLGKTERGISGMTVYYGDASCTNYLFYISALTNAHAASVATTGYKGVCLQGYTPTTATCSGANEFIDLSATTNAHAAVPGSSYTINLCFDKLACQTKDGNVACDNGYECIVTLSSLTNAHIADCSSTGYLSSSNKKICCGIDNNNNGIPDTQEVCSNDPGCSSTNVNSLRCSGANPNTPQKCILDTDGCYKWVDQTACSGTTPVCSDGECVCSESPDSCGNEVCIDEECTLCGNGEIDSGEECDIGTDKIAGTADDVLGDETCNDFGCVFGTITLCADGCFYDIENECSGCEPCELSNARWSRTDTVSTGTIVQMLFDSTGTCAGKIFTFEVWEDDLLSDTKEAIDPEYIFGQVYQWTTRWQEDIFDLIHLDNNPEYYFKVKDKDTGGLLVSSSDAYSDEIKVSVIYTWKTEGDWEEFTCPEECGGEKIREVWCEREDGEEVGDSYCSGTKPDESQSCGGCQLGQQCDEDLNTCEDIPSSCQGITECDTLGVKQCSSDQTGYEECEEDSNGCYVWSNTIDCETDEICIEGECTLHQLGIDFCSQYITEEDCEGDAEDVADESIELLKGDGFCDGGIVRSYTNPQSETCRDEVTGCSCKWGKVGDETTDKCYQDFTAKQICQGEGIEDFGTCEYSYEIIGDCTESGVDEIQVTITFKELGGFIDTGVCDIGDSYTIPCGSLTQLPFFGIFNFIMAIAVLIVIYYFKINRFD